MMSLDIGLLHPSRLLRHEISQKKLKRPKKFFEGHVKDQIEKKRIFLYFFCPNMIKWLRKFSQCRRFDLQGLKDQKGHKKAEYS